MAHKILGERFISRSEPAWHKLGLIFNADDVISPSEAVKAVAGDVQIEERRICLSPSADDPEYQVIKGHKAIVRKPTPDDDQHRVFGFVTDQWQAMSYPDLAKCLDGIGNSHRVETAGLLENGSNCRLSARRWNWFSKQGSLATGGMETR